MKVIIVGKTSYVGTNVRDFLVKKGFDVNMVSARNGIKNIDFSGVDVVIHCAAIVHKKERKKEDKLKYMSVNKTLADETAKKAKSQGVSQFIFLSSMSLYGNTCQTIHKNTKTSPGNSMYALSKKMAEDILLENASDDNFIVTILRPPMIYGKNCPGNYRRLSAFIKKYPFFPKINNKKSLLYIENLSFFIYQLIENKSGGIFRPMDKEYVSTSYMAEVIAKASGKKIKLSALLGFMIKHTQWINIVKKAFGSLYYDDDCADKIDYITFEEAIEKTENNQ